VTVPKAATSRRSPYFGGAETPPRIRIVSLAAPDLPRIDLPTGFTAIVRSEDLRDPASFLIARIGTKTSSESQSAFLARVAGR
jgi:hypothetical protein